MLLMRFSPLEIFLMFTQLKKKLYAVHELYTKFAEPLRLRSAQLELIAVSSGEASKDVARYRIPLLTRLFSPSEREVLEHIWEILLSEAMEEAQEKYKRLPQAEKLGCLVKHVISVFQAECSKHFHHNPKSEQSPIAVLVLFTDR